MAVAFDAAYPQNAGDPDDVGFYSGGQVTTGTWTHTCTGINLVLIVDVCLGAQPDGGIGANASFGGRSMTQVAAVHPGGSNGGLLVRFKLVNAAAGRNNVTVNVTGGKATIVGASKSFSGADQSTGLAATTYSATGNSSTQTVAVAANTNGNLIDSSCSSSATEGFPIGANGTRTWVRNATGSYLAGKGQGGYWPAIGSSVTTSFPLDSSAPWAIISNEVLSASTGTVMLTTANLQLSAGTFGSNAVAAQWWSQISRAPDTFFAGAPPLLPLQIGISNVAGEWLFAIITWRQDAGNLGQLTFPSTVNVSDDAGNFWIPVEAGLPNTGIVRTAIWMAPAARLATTVTISPASTQAGDALQAAMQALIFMTTAACPWYAIEETDFAYVNQGTSLTVSQQNPTTGLFAVGVVASDNPFQMPSTVSSGFIWESLVTFPFGNNSGNTGDLQQWGFLAPVTTGADLSLTITSNGGSSVADLAGVIITVHGVSDTLAFPYKTPLENWPILVTEIASGPVINANPLMAAGAADWTLQGGTLQSVTWPNYQPYPNYQALTGSTSDLSLALIPSGQNAVMQLLSEPEQVVQGLNYSVNAWTFCPGNNGSTLTLTPQIVWYDEYGNVIETDNGVPVQPGIGQWDNLTFAAGISPPGGAPGVARGPDSPFLSAVDGGTLTWGVNPATGSKVLVVVITGNGETITSVADNGVVPVTFTQDVAVTASVGGNLINCYIYRADNVTPPAGSYVVTVTTGAQGHHVVAQGIAYTGVKAGGPAATNTSTDPSAATATVVTGNVTPAAPGALYFAAMITRSLLNPETITLEGTGFAQQMISTNGSGTFAGAAADKIDTQGPLANQCVWTLGDTPGYAAGIAVYDAIQPAATAAAAILVTSTQTLIPSSAVVYAGYCGIGSSSAYENTSPDQLSWSDISVRNFTQGAISISRGVQYEQQSLEAGRMTVNLVNSDGAMTFGNLLSTYWPAIGDTDVPIRLRAIWWQSLTPYSVLFSGFTDQITFGWDESSWFGYAQVEASDAWSRMTTQMLEPYVEEVLEDNPDVFTLLSNTGANVAVANTTPMAQIVSNFGAGSAVATFSGSKIQLAGAASLQNWQVTGIGTAATGTASLALANQGIALGYFPPGNFPLPPVNGGVTATFFVSTQNTNPGGTLTATLNPATNVVLCTAWSSAGPTWSIFIDNGGTAINTNAQLITYDQGTGAGTVTPLGGVALFFFGTASAVTTYFAVTFTQTSLTVFEFTTGAFVPVITTVACNLAPSLLGFSLGGNAGPLYATAGTVSTLGFWNSAFADFAVFPELVPPLRLATHYETAQAVSQSGLSEAQGEADVSRLARILGYAGATPVVLQEQGWYSVGVIPSADNDDVTALTDTNGQVTSSYFTNVASSTLAFMFVNGPGTLIYRRRLQQYNRQIGQWALGDNPSQNLINNSLGQSASTAGWAVVNNATMTTGSAPSVSPLFEFAAVFHGDGVTPQPAIRHGDLIHSTVLVQPGNAYTLTVLAYSPQGYSPGLNLTLQYLDQFVHVDYAAHSPTVPLAPGSLTYLTIPPTRAPNGVVFASVFIGTPGTPPPTTQFYITDVQLTFVPTATAGGGQPAPNGATGGLPSPPGLAAEVPYLVGSHLSSDRALLFNQAQLNQFGTSTGTTFQGTDIVSQPTSGVLVTIQNTPSVLARAGVPYQATLYLNNTAQQAPYYLSDPSMEDFGNWIVNTLSAPLLRPDSVTITPAATPQAMIMALQAEIADTATYRRRPLGAPEIQVVTYISKLTHSIDIGTGEWTTTYELSPYQAGTVIECDDVIHGPLSGGNLLGF